MVWLDTYLIDLIRRFIALSKMPFVRMIGPVIELRCWVMQTGHAAQYASLLTPYRMRLTALGSAKSAVKYSLNDGTNTDDNGFDKYLDGKTPSAMR